MEKKHIFVSASRVPPQRWRQAFPSAVIVTVPPLAVPEASILWLHNLYPNDLPGGRRPAGVRFVVMHDEPGDEQGLEALAQGAAGYCNAYATPELLRVIASVIGNNGLWVGESLLNRLIGGISVRSPMSGRHHEHPALDSLTEREREVAMCVARGESNKEIARELDLAERTIKAHLTEVFEKLGVRDRLQLALLLSTATVD